MQQQFQRLRGRLYRRLPVLAIPLGLLDWRPGDAPGTDGRWFYAPSAWLEHPEEAVLLHSLLHAILGHPWGRGQREQARWSLACDLTVEFLRHRLLELPLTGELGRVFYACPGETAFSAEAVYELLASGLPVEEDALRRVSELDTHALWQNPRTLSMPKTGEGEELADLWKREREKLRPWLRQEKPRLGSGTASQRLEVETIPENQTRFAGLLRRFSEVRENRHVNDIDFAYSWYAYGLAHYGGMPLLEPLEYSEERKLREMAIVLDTSASCSRGLTAAFLGAVYGILCREQLFFEQFRLHILQCDCEVQHDALVTDLEELRWYFEHLELYGGGGTDYRPAFRHIDRLVEQGELLRLGGVLYFTDGYGVFPQTPPDYPVAFVMLQYRYDDINIPSWAETLVLDAEKPGRDEGWI